MNQTKIQTAAQREQEEKEAVETHKWKLTYLCAKAISLWRWHSMIQPSKNEVRITHNHLSSTEFEKVVNNT